MNAALLVAIEASLRAVALAACVGAILAVARVRSGAVRHAAWAAVLAAMLLMPLLPRLTPALDVPVSLPVAAEPAPALPDLPVAPAMRSAIAPMRAAPAPVAHPIPAPTPSRDPVWPVALLGVYAAGLLFLLARMAVGWRAARRILQSCEPLQSGAGLQSPLVASPLTIGVFSPRIVLPCAWPTWPEAKLRAVLAHEAAHVGRHDAIVNFAAQLNRCLFWFHPLAWWIERQLALTAEQACDEAAVRATGQGSEYAQVLVDLAETVRRTGGRLCLQGVGMDGAAPLERRIARILRGDLARSVSRPRKAAVAVACAVAIFLVAACRPSHVAQSEDSSALLFAPNSAARLDPAAYAQAKRLWLEQADRAGQPASVYLKSASFFWYVEPPIAEKMLLRAQAADPKGESLHGMYHDSWSARLGSFYAQEFALYVSRPPWNGSMRSELSQDQQASYLAAVSRKLAQSRDATLLLSAANVLVVSRPNQASRFPGMDVFATGKAALERALQLDPRSTWARQIMNKVRDQELLVSLPEAVWNGPEESRHRAIEALPEGDRFRELSILAVSEGQGSQIARRIPGAQTSWTQSARYAREAMDLAPKVRDHPDYGTAFFRVNMVLGMAALSAGDAKTADAYLLKAADAPATDDLRYPMAGLRPWQMTWQFPTTLTAALLKAGERDAVADFLDRYARICVTDHDRSLKDAALIRSGKTPAWAGI